MVWALQADGKAFEYQPIVKAVKEGKTAGHEDREALGRVFSEAARLGRVDIVEKCLDTGYLKLWRNEPTKNNVRHFLGRNLDWQTQGIFSEGLIESMLQSVSNGSGEKPVIRVFPAWPKERNAVFSLRAKGDFIVTSSMENGEVEFVEIKSQLGGECNIRNAWGEDVSVDVYRNGVKSDVLTGDLLTFDTVKDENIILVKSGEALEEKEIVLPQKDLEAQRKVINNDSSDISYVGDGWSYSGNRSPGDYANDVHQTSNNGDCVEFTFYGNGIKYIGAKNHDVAEQDIYIDNQLVEIIDGSTTQGYLPQSVLYSNKNLSEGTHTIKIVKKSREWMVVDAFAVYNIPTPSFDIRIDNNVTNGEIIAEKTKAKEGEIITLTVNPEFGYRLKEGSIKVNNGEVEVVKGIENTYTFEMPKKDVKVTAEFEKIPAEKPVLKKDLSESVKVKEGENLKLEVSAASPDGGNLTYQWYFDGKAMEGANDSSYEIQQAEKADSGEHKVKIINTLENGEQASITSSVCTVQVEKSSESEAHPVRTKVPPVKMKALPVVARVLLLHQTIINKSYSHLLPETAEQ